jgi:hypothetical protein
MTDMISDVFALSPCDGDPVVDLDPARCVPAVLTERLPGPTVPADVHSPVPDG